MKENNFMEFRSIWREIPQVEKDKAAFNNQFIICLESDPKYPLMKIVVYDPTKQSPENMKAIFRNIEEAKLFVDSLVCLN